MFTTEQYNSFFRDAAERHINIQHNVLAESQDGPISEASFFIGIDKAINGVRTQQSTTNCTLIVLKYEAKGRENGALDYRAIYKGGFIVCKSAEASDASAIEDAEVVTEKTAWDIINLMIQTVVDTNTGLHCPSRFGELDLNDFSISHVGPFLDNQWGWLVEFDFLINRNDLINIDRIDTQFT